MAARKSRAPAAARQPARKPGTFVPLVARALEPSSKARPFNWFFDLAASGAGIDAARVGPYGRAYTDRLPEILAAERRLGAPRGLIEAAFARWCILCEAGEITVSTDFTADGYFHADTFYAYWRTR